MTGFVIECKCRGTADWSRQDMTVFDSEEDAQDYVLGLYTAIMEFNDAERFPINCESRAVAVSYEFRVVPFSEGRGSYTLKELYNNVQEWNAGRKKK